MKKHIAQTVMALLLLVSVFFLSKEGAQLANGTPKESKGVIVVDSGHGGIDPGVIGQNELKEKVERLNEITALLVEDDDKTEQNQSEMNTYEKIEVILQSQRQEVGIDR